MQATSSSYSCSCGVLGGVAAGGMADAFLGAVSSTVLMAMCSGMPKSPGRLLPRQDVHGTGAGPGARREEGAGRMARGVGSSYTEVSGAGEAFLKLIHI